MENRRSFLKKSGLLLAAGSFSITALSKPFRGKKLPAENRVVTLYVDTANITGSDIDQYCNFGQPAGIANKDFVTDVNVGDTITWEGVSSNPGSTDVVHIASINYHHGRRIFDQDNLPGDRGNRQRVSRKVLYRTDNEPHKYTLAFTVVRNGVRRGEVFRIDPVIQAH